MILEDEEDLGPSIFTGNAIEVWFPDAEITIQTPNGPKPILKPQRSVTFPHWVHIVLINGEEINVLGENLEISMVLNIEGQYIPIKKLNKEFLYHGLEEPPVNIGRPQYASEHVFKYKFTLKFHEDGSQKWEQETLYES